MLEVFSKITKFLAKPFTKRKREIEMLKEHPIFRDLDSWINVKLVALDIKSPSKRLMAEAYLKIYLTDMRSFFIHLCETYDEYTNGYHNIYQSLHTIINTTNQKAISEYVPNLFIDKMIIRFFKHIDILSQSISSSCQQKSYSTDYDQMSSILDMSLLFLRMEVDTIESVINSMNGELEKILKGTIYDADL